MSHATPLLAAQREETKYQSVTGEEIREKDTERTNAAGSQSVNTSIEAATLKKEMVTTNTTGASSMNTAAEETKSDDSFDDDVLEQFLRLADDDVIQQFFNLFDVDGDGDVTVKEIVDTLKNMDRELNLTEILLFIMIIPQIVNKYITLEDIKKQLSSLNVKEMADAFVSKSISDKKYFSEQFSEFDKLVKAWPKLRKTLTNNPDRFYAVDFNVKSQDEFHFVILITFQFTAANVVYGRGDIHCEVNVDGTVHNAFVAATDGEGFDEIIVGMHRIFCLGRLPKTICLKVGEEEEIIIDYKHIPIDKWTKEENTCEDIKESKSYKTDTYQIYQEEIGIKCALLTIDENQCNVYIDREKGMKEYVDVFSESISADAMKLRGCACCEYTFNYPLNFNNMRHLQFYYCAATKTVYSVHNDTVQKSNVYSLKAQSLSYDYYDYKKDLRELGDKTKKTTSWEMRSDRSKTDDEAPVNSLQVFLYQNITSPIWIGCRYHFIKECCLYGQDNEFNIFRSLCFMKPGSDMDKKRRFAIAIVCLTLQICLTVGIVTDVINNEEMLYNEDRDDIIVAISVLSFSFISFSFLFTVRKFLHFYISMHEVCVISWVITFVDFVSNIVIGFIICVCSLLFLLQSETVIDTVLNSFALIFVIELDDFINLFEADENVLIQNDWDHYKKNIDWDFQQGKRKINVLPDGRWYEACCGWIYLVLVVAISPLYWLWAMIHFIWGSVKFCKKKMNKILPINAFNDKSMNS